MSIRYRETLEEQRDQLDYGPGTDYEYYLYIIRARTTIYSVTIGTGDDDTSRTSEARPRRSSMARVSKIRAQHDLAHSSEVRLHTPVKQKRPYASPGQHIHTSWYDNRTGAPCRSSGVGLFLTGSMNGSFNACRNRDVERTRNTRLAFRYGFPLP